jgi:hypothetical protein
MPGPDDPFLLDDTDAEREIRQALDALAEQQRRTPDGRPTRDQLVSAVQALTRDDA